MLPELRLRLRARRHRERLKWRGHRGRRRAARLVAAEQFVAKRVGWRLARAFALAWEGLLDPDRRVLIRYWAFEVGDGWTFYPHVRRHPDLRIEGQPALATCEDEGRTLCFRASLTERLPVVALVALVRHEIAHVLQHAAGEPLDEAEADQMMGEWRAEWSDTIRDVLAGRLV